MERSFFVVVYDVVDDKRRLKIARYLESIGERAQKSVFEVYLTPQELEKLLRRMKKLINEEEDGVRVYQLCENCRAKVHSLGLGEITQPPSLVIV